MNTTSITYRVTDYNGLPVPNDKLLFINSFSKSKGFNINYLGYFLHFESFDDKEFKFDLQLINSDLPEIIAYVVKEKYVNNIFKIKDAILKLTEKNPMNYDLSQGHKFYEFRIVNFLIEAALGMTSKSIWSKNYDLFNEELKEKYQKLDNHFIDLKKLKKNLINTSQLDNPTDSKMGYGSVYNNERGSFIKLNFQIKA